MQYSSTILFQQTMKSYWSKCNHRMNGKNSTQFIFRKCKCKTCGVWNKELTKPFFLIPLAFYNLTSYCVPVYMYYYYWWCEKTHIKVHHELFTFFKMHHELLLMVMLHTTLPIQIKVFLLAILIFFIFIFPFHFLMSSVLLLLYVLLRVRVWHFLRVAYLKAMAVVAFRLLLEHSVRARRKIQFKRLRKK